MNIVEIIPWGTVETTIAQRFEQVAEQLPDQIAIEFGDQKMTYSELNAQANHVAHTILNEVDEKEARISFFLEHGLSQIIALLGTIKACKPYVALDTHFPAERNQYMLKDSGSRLLVTNSLNLSQARALAGDIKLLNIDEIDKEGRSGNPTRDRDPDSMVFIMYTSGSTGEPKGVIHTNRGIVHYIKRFSEAIGTNTSDRIAFYYSISFSAHTMPILTALLNGATLMIYDLRKDNLSEFAKWLRSQKVTATLMIPSTLRHFQAVLNQNFKMPAMRQLWIGGETLYRSDVDKIRKHLKKHSIVINLYASSEAFFSRYYTMDQDTVIKTNIVPIGYYVEDMDIDIVDEELKRVDPNQVGEILIKSPYLATGYLNKPDQTSEDFIFEEETGIIKFRSKDLGYKQSDGCIVHIGRSDSMVKVRGYRVDLGEIENNLLQHKNLKEASVQLKENPYGTKHIVAYVVAKDDSSIDFEYLKMGILRMLPEYMVPSYFVQLKSLPRNEIGKLDKKAIPDPDWNRFDKDKVIIQPKNAIEYELQEIFQRILEVQPISMDDNILDLGADSLRLFVAFDEIEKKYGKKLNIDSFVENPTLTHLAKVMS